MQSRRVRKYSGAEGDCPSVHAIQHLSGLGLFGPGLFAADQSTTAIKSKIALLPTKQMLKCYFKIDLSFCSTLRVVLIMKKTKSQNRVEVYCR